jgi:pyruvate dehydrogenase E1 component
VENLEYIKPDPNSEEMQYLQSRRAALGGFLPQRKKFAEPVEVPPLSTFDALLQGSGERAMSTTMAFVRLLTLLTRDKKIGKYVVPIVPDEARTFGMEGMFRQLGIYSSVGQLYTPQDRDQVMFYKEDKTGQILEEGITEAGGMSSWIAAATAYSTHGISMIPFFIYYSMFGFQRIGDFAWAAGDMCARGFLIGGTAGRTTLNGEGLQHEDGHSHVLASTIPNCVSYDPCFAYEMAVIVHHGMRRMMENQENVFFYITAMNENYPQPAMPEGVEEDIVQGIYALPADTGREAAQVQLLGSGTILREVMAAAELLKADWGVTAQVWSVTSFNQLGKDVRAVARWNRLHPEEDARQSVVARHLNCKPGPVIAASDYVKAYADQIRSDIAADYVVLGTDGFGRSDTRANLRRHFEVDRYHVAIAALKALADAGQLDATRVGEAIRRYAIDADKPDPYRA